MELSKALADFLMAKTQEALAAGTIQQYGWHLGRLVVWLQGEGVLTVGEVERGHLRRWGASLYGAWSVATVKCAVVAAKGWFRWCHQEGLCSSDPGTGLKFPKVPLQVQKTVSAEQLEELLAVCDGGAVKGVRDAALLSLLFDSGLRRRELLSLTPGCLDFERGVVSVPRRKGGNAGWSVMGQGTMVRLQKWLKVREPAEGIEALFVQVGGARPGQALQAEGLKTLLARLAAEAGLPRLGAHAFRRGWAVALVEAGAPTRVIQEAAGWSSEQQLLRYTQALDAQRLARQFSPVDRMRNGGGSTGAPEADGQLPLWASWPPDRAGKAGP